MYLNYPLLLQLLSNSYQFPKGQAVISLVEQSIGSEYAR